MARKRSVFFHAVQPFLKGVSPAHGLSLISRMLVLSLVTVFLTTVIPPVLSQISTVNTIAGEIADAQQLVQQGKEHYDAGQFHLAEESLSKAAQIFATQGNLLKQAIALSNLSLTYQQFGELDLAEQVITKSLNILGFNFQSLQSGKIPEVSKEQLRILAKTLDIQGRLWLVRGKPDVALNIWKLAANTYTKLGDLPGITGSLINQAQALQTLGLYQDAKNTLEQVQQTLEKSPDPLLKAKGLRSLGDTLRAIGDLKKSKSVLQESLKIAEELPFSQNKSEAKSAALLSLSNTLRLEGNIQRDRQDTNSDWNSLSWRCANKSIPDEAAELYQQAGVHYQQVIETSPSIAMRVEAQLNHLSLLLETKQWSAAKKLWPQIQLANLSKTRKGVYSRINLAKSLACLQQQNTSITPPLWENINKLITTAVQDADELKDDRAKSYALGNQGALYEYFGWLDKQYQQNPQSQKWINKAQQLTQEALVKAQPIQAPDIAYQWQWQMGRLLASEGDTQKAIAAYQGAAETLKSARGDLLAINPDIQFSFRDNVEPVYRELVDLLLRTEGNSKPSQENLEQAIQQIGTLQLAELENFLRCNLSASVQIDKALDPKAALIYPMILENRLAVILQLPEQPKEYQYHETIISRVQVEKTLRELRSYLSETSSKTLEVVEKSTKVYEWLLRPFEQILDKSTQIETLVFVLDGILRNIPMAVLYDGKQEKYLIEKKYAIAIAPNLQLFAPQPLEHRLNVFVGGVGTPQEIDGKKFEEIKNLKAELEGISKVVPADKPLVNADFNQVNLQQALTSGRFSVVHMKTHGEFSSDPEATFIVGYNELIKGNDLANLIESGSKGKSTNIELLVLSACQTAQGDNRAVLGLAGIAVRAGARSTVSTLWEAQDEPNTKLMLQFYKELSTQKMTRGKALHNAQKDLFKSYNDPHIWAPYVLVGNWL